jgi:hypothetical protein
MNVLVEVAGWIAALLILVAYALVTTGRLQPRSVTYQALNVLGALGFIINSSWNGAIPSAALNVVWLGIGIVALARLRRAPAERVDR